MFTYILQNWNTRILYGPAIPLLGIYIYQKGMHICAKKTCSKIFHSSIIQTQTTQMSVNTRTDSEVFQTEYQTVMKMNERQ